MQTNFAPLRQQGFTLVELLVVISIIGILMGLLLPAVMSVQGQARIAQCINNQKNVATALLSYESSKQCFPGYRNVGHQGTNTVAQSWVPCILEELGAGDAKKAWRKGSIGSGTGADALPNLPVMACPADGRKNGYMSYKINSGLNSTSTDKKMRFTGVALNTQGNTALKVAVANISDGAANTILFGENAHAGLRGTWARVDEASQFYTRLVYTTTAGTTWSSQVAINKDVTKTDTSANYARPTSNHRGIAVISFCDGRSISVKDTIDYNVYKAAMAPNDAMANSTCSTNIDTNNTSFGN